MIWAFEAKLRRKGRWLSLFSQPKSTSTRRHAEKSSRLVERMASRMSASSFPCMRLFLAIEPPRYVLSAIWAATAGVREAGADVSWVTESRLQPTLKFFGGQPDAAVAPLAGAMRAIGRSHSAPVMRIGGIGAFPNFRRPRVVWIGVEPEPRL